MANGPDRVFIDKKDKLYEKLDEEKIFHSSKRDRKDQFIFAMALGFINELKREIENKEGFVRTEYFSNTDIALINAVALYTNKDINVLNNKKEVYKIAEEYAHAGIKLLVDKIESSAFGTFDKFFEADIRTKLSEKLKTM